MPDANTNCRSLSAEASRLTSVGSLTNTVLPKRTMITGLLTFCGCFALAKPLLAAPVSIEAHAWGIFKERFVVGGRVVDTGNGSISHSEGQGIALLAAVHNGDRASFEQIYSWTRGHLRRPYDSLHSWRYKPNAAYPVDDPNNATDGDLLITLALFTAASRWDEQRYRKAALELTRDIRIALVREVRQGVVLLPGIVGFMDQNSVTVNPSYYIFPALRAMSLEMPDPIWARLRNDGLAMLRGARFGRWNLPPDWLSLPNEGLPRPAEHWPPRFSFDAVRVPLYMCWEGLQHDRVVDAIEEFWTNQGKGFVPAWTDLSSGELAPYAQSAGMTAIRQYVMATRLGQNNVPAVPSIESAGDYYAAALILLVQIAMISNPARAG